MEISYPVWLPKTFGSQQNAEEMNALVQVLQNHAENISEQHKRLVASSGGIYPGKISTTSTLPSDLGQGVFLVTQPGTYKNFGNVVLPAADATNNYMGFIFWDGNSFSLDYFPIAKPDMTAVNDAIEKIDDFIENFHVDVDKEFDVNSENPIANREVASVLFPKNFNLNPSSVSNSSNSDLDSTADRSVYNRTSSSEYNINSLGVYNTWTFLSIDNSKNNIERVKGKSVGYIDTDLFIPAVIIFNSKNEVIKYIDNRNTSSVKIGSTKNYYFDFDFEVTSDMYKIIVQYKKDTSYTKYLNIKKNSSENGLEFLNKKIGDFSSLNFAFIGDSITFGVGTDKTYHSFLADDLLVNNTSYAVNGAQYNQMLTQLNTAKSSGINFETIFIFGGTNDYNSNIPLGDFYNELTESVNKNGTMQNLKRKDYLYNSSTFKGRINNLLLFAKKNFPNSQIVLVTPLHRGYATFGSTNVQPAENYSNSLNLYINDYVNAIREASDIYSVPLLDLFKIGNLLPTLEEYNSFFTNSSTDMLHPNRAGHYRLYQIFKKWITNNLVIFSEE
ncbi:SGNH/GDSL hydrolase family protein [Chishuiella sp.]|uniref:SGNH/GDSL hydrolase family protein n=1 Tax=Chishuiella sp. TaxID=1969467 RepID=UPI0028A8EDDB|nr:SGNH/GDSL hydrolase family protein [Chishuiella sp.]